MRTLARLIPVIAFISLAPLCEAGGGGAQEGVAPLTLEKAIRVGLARNAALASVRSGTQASGAEFDAARAARWPRVFTEAGLHRTDNQVQAFGDKLTAAEFTPQDFAIHSLNHPDSVSHGSAAIVVEAPLYTSGRIRSEMEAAGETSLAAAADLRSAETDLVEEITEAWDGVILATAAADVAEGSLTSASGHERVAQARFESGSALKSEFLRARTYRLARESDVERRRADLDVTRAQLRLLLGLDRSEPLVLATGELQAPAEDLGSLEDWIGTALSNRPEIEAARRDSLAVSARNRAEIATRGPEVLGTVRYEWNASALDAGEGSFFAGVGIRWAAFDAGRGARINAAGARASAAAARTLAAENGTCLEIERAYRGVEVADLNINRAIQAVEAAEEARRINAERYAGGLLAVTDLLDAETELLQAKLAAISARFDAVVSRVRLLRAAGRLEVPR